MAIRRLSIPVALLVIGPLLGSCGLVWYFTCPVTPSPGAAPVLIQEGFSTELKVQPEKAKLYEASLRFKRSDLAGRSLDSDLPEAAISLDVAVVDAQGTVRSEREITIGGRSNFSADDRDWSFGFFDLTTDPQVLRITIRHVDSSLSGLSATFVIIGQHAKTCD